MNLNCEWCGKHRRDAVGMSGYTDEKNGVGRENELFPDSKDLLPITICCECLFEHVSKHYPDSPIYKDCKQRLEYAGEL